MESRLYIRQHLLCRLQNLEAILQISQRLSRFLKLRALILDELFLACDLLLDLLKEQAKRLLLIVTDLLELFQKTVDILGRRQLDHVLLALVLQEHQLLLRHLALLNLRHVR